MILLLLAIGQSNANNVPVGDYGKEIVYQVESPSAPTANDSYAFLEKKGLMAGYLARERYPDALNPKIWRPYKTEIVDGVITLSFNHISIPQNVFERRKWQSQGANCTASPRLGNDLAQLLIVCTQGAHESGVSAFVYSRSRGITGFFSTCFGTFNCWYQLKSKRGLLAELTADPK